MPIEGVNRTGEGHPVSAKKRSAKRAAKRATAAELRRRVLERFSGKLDKYLPRGGELKPWTISAIETALSEDMNDIARDVIESRIDVDPERIPHEKPVCPICRKPVRSVAWERPTHKITIFGKIHYRRAYAPCHACGVAFSPSGHRVRLRQGLL